jgi:hypothetical protein
VLDAHSAPPSGAVYVLNVGSRYVVSDPAQYGSGWYYSVILDNRFAVLDKFIDSGLGVVGVTSAPPNQRAFLPSRTELAPPSLDSSPQVA